MVIPFGFTKGGEVLPQLIVLLASHEGLCFMVLVYQLVGCIADIKNSVTQFKLS
jgi:hypothetical protein